MGNRSRSRVHCDVIFIVEASREKDYNKNEVIMPYCLWDCGAGGAIMYMHTVGSYMMYKLLLPDFCHIPRLLDWECDHVLCSKLLRM